MTQDALSVFSDLVIISTVYWPLFIRRVFKQLHPALQSSSPTQSNMPRNLLTSGRRLNLAPCLQPSAKVVRLGFIFQTKLEAT